MAKPRGPAVPRKGTRNLADFMQGLAKPAQPTEPAVPLSVDVKPPEPVPAGDGAEARRKLPYVNTIVTEDDHDRLKMLAIQKRTSIQKLGIEAWNLLLRQEGLPEPDAGPRA